MTRINMNFNAEVSEGGTRGSRIETAAQSRPSLVDGSWAQPEGTAAEWRMVVDAIKVKRSDRPGRRIGVTVHDDGRVKFYSPRNCTGPDDVVRVAANEVGAWLESAEALLANAEVSDRRAHAPENTTGANGGSLH